MQPVVIHTVAAAIVVGSLGLAVLAPGVYEPIMEEDRAVEWATVGLFLAAGVVRSVRAVRHRRVFDGLVALFCLFVAGEEISWGQRLIGYTPPPAFLEHNFQQEANLHNFADVFGRPKWVLIMSLVGYGLVLPALARSTTARRLLDRLGATAPAPLLAPWFLAAVALLVWYPYTFTGEWVELLAGWLFFGAAPVSAAAAGVTAIAALPMALGMTWVSAERGGDAALLECARSEVSALLHDLVAGGAATEELDEMASVHKRVWGSIESGYVDADLLRGFYAAPCVGRSAESIASRRRFAVDPWGTAYWLDASRDESSGNHRLVVYSFGPNRRRDGEPGLTTGDDVGAVGTRR